MAQSNNLLFVLLLLLCSTLCLSVHASSTEENEVLEADVFKPKTKITKVRPLSGSGGNTEITPEKIKPPALFAAAKDGVIVVIAEVNYKTNGAAGVGAGQEKFDVVSRNFETKNGGNLKKEVFAKVDENNWKAQLATENSDTTKIFFKIMASTVSADKDKIYVFLLNITDTDKNWKFKLVEGKVNGGTGEKTIKWEKESFTLTKDDADIKNIFNGNAPELPLTDGSVFLTGEKEEQVVFVFKGKFTGTGGGVGKNVITFFQFKKQEKTGGKKLELLEAKSFDGSYSFFKWKDKIFRTPIDNPSGGSDEVMVLKNNNFESSADPIARLRDFLKDKQNFAAATIGDNNKVLLFTQRKPESSKNVVLWMSDGSRVFNLGIIITNVKTFFYGSLLRTETELFLLYQTYETVEDGSAKDNKIHLTVLKQLENIRKTLDAWKNNDEKIKEIYEGLATAMDSRFTDGLVGFLSNINVSDTWKNEYSNMDATVHGGSKKQVTDGFAFSGKGAGAVWLVSKTEKQPYNLKDFGFTLVATVKIDNDTSGRNSILGVVMEGGSNSIQKSISLWCNGGKWGVSDGNNQAAALKTKNCVKDGKYQVALMLDKDNTFSVHIGGDELHKIEDKTNQSRDIKHFYFGADTAGQQKSAGITESYVTVTNVLLYNRPLPTNEINNLKEDVKPVEEIKAADQNVDINTGSGSSDQQPPPLSQSTTDEKKEKKEPSPLRTEDGGAGGGVRVFSLLLAVLCVSAPLLHLWV